MSEMVERVAKALFEWQASHGDWNAADAEDIREDCRTAAREAIGAMHGPTDAMCEAAAECDGPPSITWEAMIDQALKD